MKHVNEASVPWLGHSNKFPPNFEEISEDDYWSLFSCNYHTVSWAGAWLVNVEKDNPWYGAQLTIFVSEFDSTGFGFVKHVERARYVAPKKFFKCGSCIHSYKEIGSPGRCLHTYKCEKCGHSYTVDSSD